MRVAVCEDDKEQQITISNLINKWSEENKESVTYNIFPSAEQFLKVYADGNPYDIIFFDIHLEGINGIKAAKKVREQDEYQMIVFLTSRLEYVLNGYEVNAWRYLIKPLRPAELFECLNYAKLRVKRYQQALLVRSDNKLYKVAYDSILYLESYGHNVVIYTNKQTYEMRIGISQLETTLPNNFFRCHRSYIINMDYCSCIEEKQLFLNDIAISYSPKKREELMKRFIGDTR